MSSPKRHHFLPEFYQHGFAASGYLWVFDRSTARFRREQPKNTAVIGHYYSVELPDGSKDARIERFLADHVESAAKPVIAKLDRGETIDEDERDALATFASFLHFRTPRFQRLLDETIDGGVKALTPFLVESPDDLANDLRDCPDLTDAQRAISPQAMFDFLQSQRYNAKATPPFRLQTMLDQAMTIQHFIQQMNLVIIHAPKGTSFATTDAPVVTIPPPHHGDRAVGFLTEGATTVLPLTSGTLAMFGGIGDAIRHTEQSKTAVRLLNIDVVASCERFVIARDEAHIRSLVSKSRIDRTPIAPLVYVG